MTIDKELLLVNIVVVLVLSFFIINALTIYFKTQIKSFLLLSLGGVFGIVGITGVVLWISGNLDWIIVFVIFLLIGSLISSVGSTMLITTESGLWKEVCQKTSFWQRLLGDIPTIEKKKYPSTINRRILLLIGTSLMAVGVIVFVSQYFFSISKISKNLFYVLLLTSITSFIDGMLLVFFSMAYLNKKIS